MKSLILADVVVARGGGTVQLLVFLVVIALLYWIVTQFNNAQITKIAGMVAVVAAVLAVLNWLLGFDGHAFFTY